MKTEDVNENTKNLVQLLIERLEVSSEVIEDLVEVYNTMGITYEVISIKMLIRVISLRRRMQRACSPDRRV